LAAEYHAQVKPDTMVSMFRRFPLLTTVVAAGLGLVIGSFTLSAQDTDKRGRKYKAPPATARVEITILRDFNNKPIENAAVVFHPMQGERDKGNMELKTNEDGKTVIDVLPMGDTVRLQVIAKGFQTYGQDFKIDKAEMALEIKLKRPGEQYSIYKKHDQAADAGKGAGSGTGTGSAGDAPTANGKDTGKDATKNKPADSSAPPPASPPQSR
jgi:hypothetical protein